MIPIKDNYKSIQVRKMKSNQKIEFIHQVFIYKGKSKVSYFGMC